MSKKYLSAMVVLPCTGPGIKDPVFSSFLIS
jgi:hypothetical protein